MILYRPHRGESLTESMEYVKEFETEKQMKDYIIKEWEQDWENAFSKEDIVIDDKTIRDDRNGWLDTRYVCIKKFGNVDYIEKYGSPQCIGYCATRFE